jgi:hypothetical protein
MIAVTMARTARAVAALTGTAFATLARASGDTGTGAVSEMQITGGQFGMMVGGLVVLGLAIWVVAKFTSK